VIKQLYDFYGDRRVIEQYYPALEKQVRLLQDSAKDTSTSSISAIMSR